MCLLVLWFFGLYFTEQDVVMEENDQTHCPVCMCRHCYNYID